MNKEKYPANKGIKQEKQVVLKFSGSKRNNSDTNGRKNYSMGSKI